MLSSQRFCISLNLLMLSILAVSSIPESNIIFVIQSQYSDFHQKIAYSTLNSIKKQWVQSLLNVKKPKILLTHDVVDAWTIFPIIDFIKNHLHHTLHVDWVVILNENTEIDLQNLLNFLNKTKSHSKLGESHFIGQRLRIESKNSSSVIHQFDSFSISGVLYPDQETGWIMNGKLLLNLINRLAKLSIDQKKRLGREFTIDPLYEFAEFVYQGGQGVSLAPLGNTCEIKYLENLENLTGCISYPRDEYDCLNEGEVKEMLDVLKSTFVAVKTCKKYHNTRVRIVQNTWGRFAPNIEFFSEESDTDIPTLKLNHTINTLTGHCNKTLAILHYFLSLPHTHLVLVDDDTLLSMSLLASTLACYPPQSHKTLFLGQRFGYKLSAGGYSFISGGGGIVLSRDAVMRILSIGDGCRCPRADWPDDMQLGNCANKAGVQLTDSSRFHQARPEDYPMSVIQYRKPVSFHKHWEVDPYQVYYNWFEKYDQALPSQRNVKYEL